METISLSLSQQPQFLINLNSQIEKNLSDNNLTITRMTRLVGMSRTDLHRKLDKTVGMSATEYIRFVRLTKAVQLLRGSKELTVSEIAYEVGFTSLSYFTRCFTAKFGVSPTDWREIGKV